MRCKLDENLPVDLALLLQSAGHDALLVTEQGLAGTDDATLATICRDEGRAIVTLDLDFADIRAYPPADYPGLIVFRLSRLDKVHVLQVTKRLLALLEREPLEGRLWIVDEERVRVRE